MRDNDHAQPLTTLADIIRAHQDRTRDSYRDISVKTGLAKSTIAAMANPASPYIIRADTIEKLARGLRVPLETVKRAAFGSAGYAREPGEESSRDEVMKRIIARISTMDEKSLDLIESLVKSVDEHQN